MRLWAPLIIVVATYIALFPTVDEYSKKRFAEKDVRYLPQNEILDLSVLEFRNLAADMILLNSLAYVGGRKTGDDSPEIWQWLYRSLDASSYLNPYSVDPYFIAQGFLTWKGRMFSEANKLLDRGIEHRRNDWRLAFFKGFNYYYFMNEPEKGAQYLERAARMPDSPEAALMVLASRLYTMSARTELAIALVKDDYEKSRDDSLREIYEMRLNSLNARLILEKAVESYQKKRKSYPHTLQDLVVSGFLKRIPTDPEGGDFLIDEHGRIKNTREVAVEEKIERAHDP